MYRLRIVKKFRLRSYLFKIRLRSYLLVIWKQSYKDLKSIKSALLISSWGKLAVCLGNLSRKLVFLTIKNKMHF